MIESLLNIELSTAMIVILFELEVLPSLEVALAGTFPASRKSARIDACTKARVLAMFLDRIVYTKCSFESEYTIIGARMCCKWWKWLNSRSKLFQTQVT